MTKSVNFGVFLPVIKVIDSNWYFQKSISPPKPRHLPMANT